MNYFRVLTSLTLLKESRYDRRFHRFSIVNGENISMKSWNFFRAKIYQLELKISALLKLEGIRPRVNALGLNVKMKKLEVRFINWNIFNCNTSFLNSKPTRISSIFALKFYTNALESRYNLECTCCNIHRLCEYYHWVHIIRTW